MQSIGQTTEEQDRVLLIIPAYNEAQNLPDVVADIERQEPALDYVIVSDGSTDGTAELCRARGYHLIELPVNLGLAGCFQTGMKYAEAHGYRYAVQFDGDGQHRAADVEPMHLIMKLSDCDLVLGSRYFRVKKSAANRVPASLYHLTQKKKKGLSPREIGSRLISAAIWLTTGVHLTDPTCGLRMYSRRMIERFAHQLNYGPEPDTVSYLLKNGAVVAETPVEVAERASGESYLKPLSAASYMARMLVSILLIQNFRSRSGLKD